VLGAGLCIILAVPISRLTLIPFQLLAPFMIMVICFASFQATRIIADMIALLLIGVLGVYMRRFGWPRPALLIGFVLATQAETYLYQAVQFYGWDFLTRTGVMIIAAITVVSVWLGLRARVSDSATEDLLMREGDRDSGFAATFRARKPQIVFTLLVLAAFVVGIVDSMGHSFLGRVFPLFMFSLGAAFTLAALGFLAFAPAGTPAAFDNEPRQLAEGARSMWGGLIWVALLVALTAVFGFVIALVLFFIGFLRTRARASWLMTSILTVSATGFVVLLAYALNLRFPGGWLQEVTRLPWPFS
jgi:putative tricarboxylic transport membrane protein